MENNSFKTNPIGAQPITPQQQEVKEVTTSSVDRSIDGVANHVLKTQSVRTESTNLATKSITHKSESGVGFVQSVIKFFNRFFGEISLEDQKKGDEIRNKLVGLDRKLDEAIALGRKFNIEEKRSSQSTLLQNMQRGETYLKSVKEKLSEAQSILNSLKENQNNAKDLAFNYSTFGDLPTKIEEAVKQVSYLDARVSVTEKLYNIEKAIQNYSDDTSWDKFASLREQRRGLEKTISELPNYEYFNKDQEVLPYYNKELNFNQSAKLITYAFPGLKGYVERLSQGLDDSNTTRFQNLDQKVGKIIDLVSNYNQQAKVVEKLETKLYSQSLWDRFHRALIGSKGKKELRQQLDSAQKALLATGQKIEKENTFIPDEVTWVKKMAQNKALNLGQLVQHIDYAQTVVFSTINNRNEANKILNTLIEWLGKYEAAQISSDNVKLGEAQNTIQKELQNLSSTLLASKNLEGRKQPVASDILTQIKLLIPLTYPSLQAKTSYLLNLIDKQDLSAQLKGLPAQSTSLAAPAPEEIVNTAPAGTSVVEAPSETRIEEPVSERVGAIIQEETIVKPPENQIPVSQQQNVPETVEENIPPPPPIPETQVETPVTPESTPVTPEIVEHDIPMPPPLLEKSVEIPKPQNSGIVSETQPKKEIPKNTQQALLDSIQKGTTLKKVSEEEKNKPEQQTGLKSLFSKAMDDRRKLLKEDDHEEPEIPDDEWK